MSNPGIYVCGTPRGGTSCVAGILHHLGVDMGQFKPEGPDGYCTFEDTRAATFTRPMGRYPGDHVLAFFAGADGFRDFRAYLEMREYEAKGTPWGCKLGTNYPLSDPDPATLPVRWVFVDRPLEVSIRSDAAKMKPENPVERAMQIAGYWAGKEWLKLLVSHAAEPIDYAPFVAWAAGGEGLVGLVVRDLADDLGLDASESAITLAAEFVR